MRNVKNFSEFLNENEDSTRGSRMGSDLGISSASIEIDFSGSEDPEWQEKDAEKVVRQWEYNPTPPIRIKNIEGEISDESENLHIELTNGDMIEFDANFESGPPSSYYRDTGRKNPNYATLKIAKAQKAQKSYDLSDEFTEELAQWGSIIATVLKFYEKLNSQ